MVNGRRPKKILGIFPAFSIDDAARWAEGFNQLVERGVHPDDHERDEAEALANVEADAAAVLASRTTIDKAFKMYLESCTARGVRTVGMKAAMMEKDFLPRHRDRYPRDLTKADVRAVLQQCRDRRDGANLRQSNRLRSDIVAFLNWCVRNDIDDLQVNVAASIDKVEEKRVKPKRHLTVDEIVLMVRAARSVEDEDTADAYMLLALTGCRLMEVFAAQSAEMKNGVWTIPGSRTKNGHDHSLPLGPMARAIFERRHNQQYVFESRRAPETHRSSSFRKTIDRITAEMERIGGAPIARWTTHATRHGFRTYIRKMKFADKDLAERLINHLQPDDIDEMYDHDDFFEEKEAALAGWEAMLMDRLARADGGNVITMAA